MDAASNQLVPGDLRVSDADRDRALTELSEHYQSGRLTLEEFEERSGQALAARTARELTGLFTDLPRDPARTAGAGAVPDARPHLPAVRAVVAAALAVSVVAIVVAALVRGGGHHTLVVPVLPIFVVLFIVRRLGGRRSRSDDLPVQDR